MDRVRRSRFSGTFHPRTRQTGSASERHQDLVTMPLSRREQAKDAEVAHLQMAADRAEPEPTARVRRGIVQLEQPLFVAVKLDQGATSDQAKGLPHVGDEQMRWVAQIVFRQERSVPGV